MKMQTREEKLFNCFVGLMIVCFSIVISCVAICIKEAATFEVDSETTTKLYRNVSIVYTEETPRAEETTSNRLTMDERDYYASLVAGKAVGEPAGCQQAVATVLYNNIIMCNGNANAACDRYHWKSVQIPTQETYEAIDSVFERGMVLLDDDVLWFGVSGQEDNFHASLEEVCTIGNITFYRERG